MLHHRSAPNRHHPIQHHKRREPPSSSTARDVSTIVFSPYVQGRNGYAVLDDLIPGWGEEEEEEAEAKNANADRYRRVDIQNGLHGKIPLSTDTSIYDTEMWPFE